MPALTGQIVNQGVVLVYFEHVSLDNKDTTGQQVYQVPAIFGGIIEDDLTDMFKPGVLNFYFSIVGGTTDVGTLYTTVNANIPLHIITESYLYRIILIPGGVLGTNVDPHTLTYKEVSTKFGIQP